MRGSRPNVVLAALSGNSSFTAARRVIEIERLEVVLLWQDRGICVTLAIVRRHDLLENVLGADKERRITPQFPQSLKNKT